MRFKGGDDPVAAPGLPKLLDRLERDLRDVLALSERIDGLVDGPERSLDLPQIIAVELDAAEEGADEIERVTRQLAQLALGVSTGLPPGKRAERLDNAAVAVLHPPRARARRSTWRTTASSCSATIATSWRSNCVGCAAGCSSTAA